MRRSLVALALLVASFCIAFGSLARATTAAARSPWGHARIVERDGHAVFEVDGRPFFLYGAAFFYERLPRDRWRASMERLAHMHVNTLDLYVPWNWHELSDGDFDFTGRTSPRRDFDEVLELAKEFDFKIILRPGPVVRNEWRNGGYPAWLLRRPEYDMPLHDVLEGRYPSTATLQNHNSDDAAAEWMRNATHVRYAKRWLERVLTETQPYADRILAVALDDDQGAYIDNQTFPAPHFTAYIDWLRDVVHGVTGPSELTFINTYQMKVPASSPVWAMGNWYQSDAYAIGTHDEAQLEFSFAQLATRPHQPSFASEFQAGWLQGAGEALPRSADPSNTQLALATMVGTGVRGIVNFPAQDTLDPTGWEAPFANFAYAWDAALRLDDTRSERYLPTAEFGGLVDTFGAALAASYPRFDASIVYAGGSVPEAAAGGTTFSSIATATIEAQQACRTAGFACNLIDLSARGADALPNGSIVLLPHFDPETSRALGSALVLRLARLRWESTFSVRDGSTPEAVRAALRGTQPIVANSGDAVFSESLDPNVAGFLSVTNYTDRERRYDDTIVRLSNGRRIALAPYSVLAHSAIVTPVNARVAMFFDDAALRKQLGEGDVLRNTDCSPTRWQRYGADRLRLLVTFDDSARACSLNYRIRGRESAYAGGGGRQGRYVVPAFDAKPGDVVPRSEDDTYAARPTVPVVEFRPKFALDPMVPAGDGARASAASAPVSRSDVYREGSDSIVFQGTRTRLIVSPNAGARAFFFGTGEPEVNWFTTVGGLRDDVSIEPPISTKDRIARYTHDFPAGTFNRTYEVAFPDERSARFSYAAPDTVPSGMTFDRSIRLVERPGFDQFERVDIPANPQDRQRGVTVSSFALDTDTSRDEFVSDAGAVPIEAGKQFAVSGNAFAIARGDAELVVAWRAGDVEDARMSERSDSIVSRLTLAPGRTVRIVYRIVARDAPGTSSNFASVESQAQTAPQVAPSPARIP